MFPVLFSLGPLTVYSFGVFALLAFFFGSFAVWKRGREANLLEEDIFDSIVVVTISGLIGARVAYILFHFERFGFSLIAWLSLLRLPGLMLSGGLIGGFVGLWLVCRRKHWHFFEVADIGVTGLSLSQAIGWVGGFFAGMGVGREVQKFGLVFPGFSKPRFPAQFIFIIGFSLLFVFLWRVEERYRTFDWYRGRKTDAQTGFLVFSYFIGLGVLQLLVASVVEPNVYWFGIPADKIYGLALIAVGMVGLYWRSGRELAEDTSNLKIFLLDKGRRSLVFIRQGSRKLRSRFSKKRTG
jgi:phosphatidylglycerol:prolipoprotein diacylglycerol transferase